MRVNRLAAAGFTGAIVFALVGILRWAPLDYGFEVAIAQRLEVLAHDVFVRRAAAREASRSVVVVEITETDIEKLGHYPITDRELHELLDRLVRAGSRTVGLDLFRNLAVGAGGTGLAAFLAENTNVFGILKWRDAESIGVAPHASLRAAGRTGFADIVPDRDGPVRRGLLFLDDAEGRFELAFALRLALHFEGLTPAPDPDVPAWMRIGVTTVPPWESRDGGYAGEDAGGYQFLLDHAGWALPHITLTEVMDPEFDASRVRDRIVIVGVNSDSVKDYFQVPVPDDRPVAGLEIHARIADQLVRLARGDDVPLAPVSEWTETAIISLLILAGCALGSIARGAYTYVFLVVGGSVAIVAAGYAAYEVGYWVPVVMPVFAFFAPVTALVAYSVGSERAERAELMELFSLHESPEVAEELWSRRAEFVDAGRARPRRMTATVLFVDMKGYSESASKMSAEELVEWVNVFMSAMANTVATFGGIPDDYFGDGMKANFGIPIPRATDDAIAADAHAAVACAIAMDGELSRVNADYRSRGLPTVAMRIGIDTGSIVTGEIGAHKLKFTSVGEVPVTAQRLESLDHSDHDFEREPTRILISGATRALLEEHAVVLVSRGAHRLKGIEAPVEVFQVVCPVSPSRA